MRYYLGIWQFSSNSIYTEKDEINFQFKTEQFVRLNVISSINIQ